MRSASLWRLAAAALVFALPNPSASAQSEAVQQLYAQAHEVQEAGHPDDAIRIYRELLGADPSVAPAYNNLGRLLFTLARFQEAAEVLQKGLEIKPDMAPAQVMLGASYLQMNEAEKAVEPLELGVKGLPEDAFARQTLAQALLQMHQTEGAAEQLHKLITINPSDQRSWYLLGKLDLQMSQEDFAHMRALGENTPLSHQLSGEIMESMSNTPGAVAEYKQALVLAPEDSEAAMHLADLYWSTGDWAKAVPAWRAYLKQKPGDCQAEWKLANADAQLGGNKGEALTLATMATRACPQSPQAHAERARALLQENKAAEALPELNLAQASSPNEPSVQFLLAKAYHALGEEAKSKEAMARFQQLDRAEHAAKERHAADVLAAN